MEEPQDEVVLDEELSQAESDYYSEGDISALILDYAEQPEAPMHPTMVQVDASLLRKRKGQPTTAAGISLKKARYSGADTPAKVDPDAHYLIAHSSMIARMMDGKNISNGVRYELARCISSGELDYADITDERLEALQGPSRTAVPKMPQVFEKARSRASGDADDRAFAQEKAANSPWSELDKEEEALLRGPDEGLGNNPAYPGWYGGKAEFRGHLVETQGPISSYKIVLDSCTLGPSSRFTRRFGSWSFMRVKIPLQVFHHAGNNLNIFFRKPFVIWGRVFRACYAKRDNIFFYWTNETFPSGSRIPGRFSFEEFIMWHNPLPENSKQLMTKWSARTALGFSNSVPGPRIPQEYILHENDIVSENDSDMTDGCGLTTKSINRFLLNQLSLTSIPSAFQFRLAGYKGMLMIRDDDDFRNETDMRVWIRPSQTKIRYPQGTSLDAAMLTIDILRTSRLTSPSRLSSEIIINLAENGVEHNIFADLLKASIAELIQGLTTWEGPDAMFNLWANVERAGGVMQGRRAREVVGEARVRGYSNRSSEDVDLEEEDEDEDGFDALNSSAPRSIAWWADQTSGCPSTLEETVMVLLDSGFMPQSCPVLREKLKQVVCKKIESRTENLRFELEQSCTAFAVPDPFGVLGPDQVQIKSSKRNLKTEDGLLSDIILGDVLIGRTPCKLPTDIRKIAAVEHPMLRNFVDVVVFSVQGQRRLIDFLAGGDYDGDTVLAMWAPLLVSQFQNADEKFSHEPAGLDLSFTRDNETGAVFLKRSETMDETTRIHAMQVYLLGALVDPSLVGKYSMMHNNTIYKLGYGHPRTHKIACKFARVLDAPKTGYRIKPETYMADRKQYDHPHGPQWLSTAKKEKKKAEKSKVDKTNTPFLKRDANSSYIRGQDFIMDRLRSTAEKERDRLLGEMEKLFSPLFNQPDADLVAPWNLAVEWAERKDDSLELIRMKRKDLAVISHHVQNMYRKHKTLMSSKGSSFTELPIEKRQDGLRSLSKEFASRPNISELRTIADPATLVRYRASYAYIYDAEQNCRDGDQKWTRYPWNVALRELCAIKAAAQGPYKVVTNNFYERFRMVKHM